MKLIITILSDHSFLLGSILAPIPLFRGKYAIGSLANLPPLISRTTRKPDVEAIKSRLWWVTKSVVVTTFGTALGTWAGFFLGLRKMEKGVEAIEGGRARVARAFQRARQDLGVDQPSTSLQTDPSRPSVESNDPSAIFVPDESFYQQTTFDNRDFQSQPLEENLPSITTSNQSKAISPPSRWEELRREKGVGPSAWDTIRQQNAKADNSSSSSPRTPTSDALDPKELERKAFEELLERERKISSGEPTNGTGAGPKRWS